MNKLIFCLALLLGIQCPILLVAQDELVPPAGVTKAVEFFDQQLKTKTATTPQTSTKTNSNLKKGSRPNVLFISVDDLNDWQGALGGHPQA